MSLEWRVETGEWRVLAQQREAALRLLSGLVGEDVILGHNDEGAPYLPQHPELRVSISHCRSAVAVAVSDSGPVGIDVESRRRISEGLVERVCNEGEKAVVRAAADPTMTFLRLWTKKEAVLKMRGTGIRGFGSMAHALDDKDASIQELPCAAADTVASVAFRND